MRGRNPRVSAASKPRRVEITMFFTLGTPDGSSPVKNAIIGEAKMTLEYTLLIQRMQNQTHELRRGCFKVVHQQLILLQTSSTALTPDILLINSLKVICGGMTIGLKVSSGASRGTGIAANTAYLACTISDGSSEPGVAYMT